MTTDEAVQQILAATCGYARLEGRHICKVTYRVDQGCDPTSWQALRWTVADIVRQLTDEVRPAPDSPPAGQLSLEARREG